MYRIYIDNNNFKSKSTRLILKIIKIIVIAVFTVKLEKSSIVTDTMVRKIDGQGEILGRG